MNIFHLLTVLFVGLKLAHIIDWSWWLVLAPAYGFGIACGLYAGFLGVLVAMKEYTR